MQDSIVYQNTAGGSFTPNQDQYSDIVSKLGQSKVDQMFGQLDLNRVGSGNNSALLDYAKDLNIPFNDGTRDYIIESFLNERSRKNAFADSVYAAQNQYQWLVEDLKKAGLNPFLAMSGLNAAAATSSGQGVSGGLVTSRANNTATNNANIMKALLTALASIVGIALFKKA